jgi:hypothetical protein
MVVKMKYDLVIAMLKTFHAKEVNKPPSKREFDCRQIWSIIELLEIANEKLDPDVRDIEVARRLNS